MPPPSDIAFKADLAIENTTGQVLGEAKDVFSISTPSAPDRREFSMTLSFGAPFLRPGEYKALFTVHDQNSDKSGTFEVPFTSSCRPRTSHFRRPARCRSSCARGASVENRAIVAALCIFQQIRLPATTASIDSRRSISYVPHHLLALASIEC